MALQVKTDYPAQGVLQDLPVPLDQKAEMEIRVLGEKMVKLVKQDHRDLPDQMVSWDKLDRRERRLVGVSISTKGNLIFIKLCRRQGFPDDLR